MHADYTGKDVFIGIDVHKKSYSVYCVFDREKLKSWSMEAEPEKLIEQLHNYFPMARLSTVYEAGFSGYALHRALKAVGIENIVVNPGSVETASRDKVKTDKRDAKKLAEQLSDGRLKSIYIPSIEEELLRLHTRLRATIVADRKRITCRIKSKLFQFGYDAMMLEDKAATSTWIKSIMDGTCYPAELTLVLDYLCERWLMLTQDIKDISKKIAIQSQANEQCIAQKAVYKSAPGIGDISASSPGEGEAITRVFLLGTLMSRKGTIQLYRTGKAVFPHYNRALYFIACCTENLGSVRST